MAQLKLAVISSQALCTPPRAGNYGGLERVAYDLSAGLHALGHDVALIGAKDSKAPDGCELIECGPAWADLNDAQKQSITNADGVDREWRGQKWRAHTYNGWRSQEEAAFKQYESGLAGYDAVVDDSWSKWAYSSKQEKIVGVCHSVAPYQTRPPREFPMFAGVSRGHSRNLSRVLRLPVRTLWNPVDIEAYPLEPVKTERILSFNRVMPQKGIHHFLTLADKMKVKADVAGDDSTLVPDQGYVQQVKQKCAQSAFLLYHGLVDDKKRIQLLKDAKVLVCFKDAGYEEVFGLNLVEAMACGTPVVSVETWGASDIIVEGKNGFIVKTMEEAEDRVAKIMDGRVKFDAAEVRKTTERFSRATVAKNYENLLLSIQKGSRW